MPSVNDITVKKPTEQEEAKCKAWPIWKCEASTFDWAYTEKETCLLLEGEVTVTDGKNGVATQELLLSVVQCSACTFK